MAGKEKGRKMKISKNFLLGGMAIGMLLCAVGSLGTCWRSFHKTEGTTEVTSTQEQEVTPTKPVKKASVASKDNSFIISIQPKITFKE